VRTTNAADGTIPQMWDAGADYVRLTYGGNSEEAYKVFERYRSAVVELAYSYDPTAQTRAWGWLGYTGVQASTAACGIGPQGAILQVSGALSHSAVLLDLPRTGVPRLDVQVTTWGEPAPAQLPGYVSRETLAAREGANGRPWKVALINGFGAGDTCYIGSRKSDNFIRVYDKGAESGESAYAGAVRYEVELKAEAAEHAYAAMVQAGTEASDCAASLLKGILAARGVTLPKWVSVPAKARHQAIRPEFSIDRSCRWIQDQVAPTVARLLREGVEYELMHRLLFGQPHSWDLQYVEDVVP